ncbi:hypothetical protein PC116_g17240 [Phytophthora cactorum]|nr:hypothetical protein PC116_g17240 [Phytophthora cactorum]
MFLRSCSSTNECSVSSNQGGSGQSEDEPAADFASEILRRAKKPRQPQRRAVDYILLLGVIPPTSNRCEQLFSEC